MLAGQKAFPGVDIPSIYRNIATRPPDPLEARCPGVDPELTAIIAKCLEKAASNRYQSMTAARGDLERVRQRLIALEEPATMIAPTRKIISEAQEALERGDFTVALQAS